MKSKVVESYLLTPVDKALAVSLVSKGFDFCYITIYNDKEYVEWFNRFVYDEETDEEKNFTDEEIMKEIASSNEQIYMAQFIPIDFVERGKGDYVGTAKYDIGSTVYVNITKNDGDLFGSIKKGRVIGVDIREGIEVIRHIDTTNRRFNIHKVELERGRRDKYITYKVVFEDVLRKDGCYIGGVFTEGELTSDLDELINKLKSEIK